MITMHCPSCHEELHIPDPYAGQAGACKKCGARILVPGTGAQTTQPMQDATAPAGSPSASELPDDLTAAIEASLSAPPRKPVVTTPSLGDRLEPLIKPLGIGFGVIIVVAAVMTGLAYMPKLNVASKPSPEEVTRGFMEASKSGDMKQCKPYVTAKTWEVVQYAPAPSANMPKVQRYTVGAATKRGTTSEVPVQVVNQLGVTVTNNILLRQEAGNWRVYGTRVEPMPGMEMTLNFEDPQATADELKGVMEKMSPEMIQKMMQQ